ncbi:MAG: hypothetical protein LBR16_03325 [Treponema sp.]|jgi:hypothetical protein|nr:hypothetical protein [Treponema sp.]
MPKCVIERSLPRFLYLNIYAFLLVLAGAAVMGAPFYLLSKWTLIPQAAGALFFFNMAYQLFSTWEDKKSKISILTGKNKAVFRPDTFTVFMQAPCSRLMVRYVLAVLGKSSEYRSLLAVKKPFLTYLKEGCVNAPEKTVVYLREEAL